MLNKFLLPVILILLGWGFWVSPQFKEIAAGVAIFLFGMMGLEQGFRAFTGGTLERLLNASTDKLWKSLGLGMISTTIMQSSSLVSVITISFLSAGLIDLGAGIGIIFGSNIGTTTGAWLVAGIGLKVDIAAYALPLIVFGVILVYQSSKSLNGLGYILAGIGFLFLGIHFMKTGFETFQESIDLSQFSMTGVAGLLVYTAVGIVATVAMQSSHATLILGITALAAGQITYENSLAIAIGSNMGTTVTALIGSMGSNVAGKRLALAHLIFNVITGVIAIIFISPLAQAVDAISEFLGIAADNFTLKFAVFHTLFNVIGVVIMTPLISRLVSFLGRLIPDVVPDISVPHFLNEAALAFPDTALKAIVDEARHLYENVFNFIAAGIGLKDSDFESDKDLEEIVKGSAPPTDLDLDDLYQRRIKGLYSAIVDFASRAETDMLPDQVEVLYAIRSVGRDLVLAVKDVKHLHKNLQVYSTSSNEDMREQYGAARLLIATILRATQDIRDGDREASLQTFEQLKSSIDHYDIVDSGELDRLIRERRISPEMATSLINDSGYTLNISRRLTNAAMIALGEPTQAYLQKLEGEEDPAADEEEMSGMEARAASDT